MAALFTPAVKAQLKARVALCGPSGAGKTWTALAWATVLAKAGDGRIAFVDTERDSARLYANHFAFDVCRFDPPYEVPRLIKTISEADAAGYDVVVADSLTHFWEGEGGVLEEVDAAAARNHGNSYAGWKHGTPLQRHMVDTFLGLDCHLIVCMRSKMAYELTEYTDSKGNKRSRPEKIGLQPVQRAGMEYEFQVVGDLDLEHRITISKTRCDVLADKVIQPHREREAAETFLAWLNDGEPPPPKADPEEVAGFLAKVKDADDTVRLAMNAWWKEQGYVAERLDLAQLTTARGRFEQLAADPPAPPEPEPEADDGDGQQELA